MLFWAKVKMVAAVVCAMAVLGTGTGFVVYAVAADGKRSEEKGEGRDDARGAKPALPAVVESALQKVIKERCPQGEVKRVKQEREGGRLVYEIVLQAEGKSYEVEIDEKGKVLEVEADDGDDDDNEVKIPQSELPKAVQDALAKVLKDRFPGGEVKEVEKETEKGRVVYGVEIRTGEKVYEVEFDAKGKILEIEADDGDDDDAQVSRPEGAAAGAAFQFIYKYGVGAKNILNTVDGTYTRDMVIGEPAKTELALSAEEMQGILAKMKTMKFFDYPEKFSYTPKNPGLPGLVSRPSEIIYFKVTVAGKTKELWWTDPRPVAASQNEAAAMLWDLTQWIKQLIQAKDAYKKLPAPRGGYM